MNKFKNDMGSSKVNRRTKNHNNKMMAAASTSAVTGQKSMVAEMMRTRHVHGPQVTEAFSKLFFEDTIKPTLDIAFETAKAEAVAKAAAENTKVKMPSSIAVIKKQTNLLYHSASDEVKQQVAEFIEEAKKKKKKEWEEAKGAGVADHQVSVASTYLNEYKCSPVTRIYRYIDRLPGVLTEFFNELQRLTGLVFTVLMGGPTPAMGGQVDVQSFHVGATEIGNQFDLAYPEFNSGIMRPWKEFVKRVFHKSVKPKLGMRLTWGSIAVAAVKEEGSVWGVSRQPTLEPDVHASQTPDPSDGAFGNIPRNTSTMASSSNLFPHISESLISFLDDDEDLTLKVFPSYPSHPISASLTDLGPDGVSSMLSVEGYHEFLRTYVAPPTLQSPSYPTHMPTQPPTSKPFTSEVTTPANHAITAQQGPSPSPGPTLPSTPPTPKPLTPEATTLANHAIAARQGPSPRPTLPSAPPTPKPLTPEVTTPANHAIKDSLADPHPPPLSKSTSAEVVPSEFTSAEAAPSGKSTSAEAAPSQSTSAEAAPSQSTSTEAAPSGIVTMPLIESRSKRVRQISKHNEIVNSIGSENTSSKKRGEFGC